MRKEIEINVKHMVSPDATSCAYGEDVDGYVMACHYHVRRNRTHGRKAPMEFDLPKCLLFECWLDKPFHKCEACKQACKDKTDWPPTLYKSCAIWLDGRLKDDYLLSQLHITLHSLPRHLREVQDREERLRGAQGVCAWAEPQPERVPPRLRGQAPGAWQEAVSRKWI